MNGSWWRGDSSTGTWWPQPSAETVRYWIWPCWGQWTEHWRRRQRYWGYRRHRIRVVDYLDAWDFQRRRAAGMELAECLVHCYARAWRAKVDIELNIRRPSLRTGKSNWTRAMTMTMTLGVEVSNLGLELAHSLLQRLGIVLLDPDTADAKAPTRRTWSLAIAADLSPSTSLARRRHRPPPARSCLAPHCRLRLP